ncbi:MAG: BREX-1 system phosphatase PglZ type A [Myxococcales bacterium]|nr:BREX-1 system phosphatase PglZ type A [Myxococcales bacterium]
MKAHEVDKALRQKFIAEGARLVFWHDADAEFADYVAGEMAEDLGGAQLLDVAKVGGLAAKLKLETEDTAGKYLVYSSGPRPEAEHDWLLDIRLYSAEFYADVASLWLQELGLTGLYLRDHLKARAAFLGNQDRRQKLRRLLAAADDEAAIDLKMMAVLVGSSVATPFAVLRALCHGHLEDGGFSLDSEPEALATFAKMGLEERFWELMSGLFGYEAEGATLAALLRRLFVSEFFHQVGDERISALAHFELPPSGRRNAVVFLTQWRDSSGSASSYDAAASTVAHELKVGSHLGGLKAGSLRGVFTFWEAEKRVVSGLRSRVLSEAKTIDVAPVAAIASERQAGHWLAGPGRETKERRAIHDAYDAVVAAAELFALHNTHRHALTFESPVALLESYRDTLHAFDRLYRGFWAKAKPALGQGWDLLKALADEVERVYDQGFLQPLGLEWSRLLDEGFLGQWRAAGFKPQPGFYKDQIAPHLRESKRKRAFVIVSDAFRYEAAAELVEELNGRYRMDAELSAMLGVLPSYTALGMASLLPHETLSYTDKGDVLADGKSTAGTDARSKVLAGVEGMACQAKDLRVMKTDDAREFTAGKRVVYIYHNVIDARGDSAPTEGETFEAVSDCIHELVELVQFCVNKLNAAKVWVTADHGFLYRQTAPAETQKSALSHKPDHAVKVKKRYVVGRDLGDSPEAHHGSTAVTAGTDDGMEFWIPRGANRFHFTGGARFIHGGAMPQEVMVPVVTVTQLRGKKKERSKVEKVSVQVLGTKHKITTPKYRFELIQTEAVSERRKPLTLRAAVFEGDLPVTSVETVTFDSTSDSIDERKKSIRLELRTGTFDKNTPYRLVLRDVETDAEVQSVAVVIDRSFDDDF